MLNQLRKSFDRFVVLDDLEWSKIEDVILIKDYKKGEYFVKEGDRCPYVGYVFSGTFSYYYIINGQQLTRQFFFENNLMSNYQSYITNEKSKAWIEALEDATVILIKIENSFQTL